MLAGEITDFDRITFSWEQTDSIKQQSDKAYISKINKLREDLACPSTALYYNPLSLNSSLSTVSHPLSFLSLVTHVWIRAVFSPPRGTSVKDWEGQVLQRLHTWTCYFPRLIVRGDDYCRTGSRPNPLRFEVWRDTGRGRDNRWVLIAIAGDNCEAFLNRQVGAENRGGGKTLEILNNTTTEYNNTRNYCQNNDHRRFCIISFTEVAFMAGYCNGFHYNLQVFPILGLSTIWALWLMLQQQRHIIVPYWLNVL